MCERKLRVAYLSSRNFSHSLLLLPWRMCVCVYVCSPPPTLWHPPYTPPTLLWASLSLSGWLPWLPHAHIFVAPIMADMAGNKWMMWAHTRTHARTHYTDFPTLDRKCRAQKWAKCQNCLAFPSVLAIHSHECKFPNISLAWYKFKH
jgi:hypothetical protein